MLKPHLITQTEEDSKTCKGFIGLIQEREFVPTHVCNGSAFDEIEDGILHSDCEAEAIALWELACVLEQPFGKIVCSLDDE